MRTKLIKSRHKADKWSCAACLWLVLETFQCVTTKLP